MKTIKRNANKMCIGKKPFTFATQADRALNKMIKKNGLNPNERLHTYYCPCCLYWHIGHYNENNNNSF